MRAFLVRRHAGSPRAALALSLAVCTALLAAPALGQPARLRELPPSPRVAPVAAPAALPVADWTSDEPDARSCSRSRRKLWQNGDGWIVKTVTVCQ